MKNLIFLLIPFLFSAQELPCLNTGAVGINVGNCPTTTFDIGGNARVRNLPVVTLQEAQEQDIRYVVLANEKGVLYKILLSEFSSTSENNKCPAFIREASSEYYLKFKAPGYLDDPSKPIQVNGLNFNQAGNWIDSGVHYYTYTNTSGTPLNISIPFVVKFDTLTCNYN